MATRNTRNVGPAGHSAGRQQPREEECYVTLYQEGGEQAATRVEGLLRGTAAEGPAEEGITVFMPYAVEMFGLRRVLRVARATLVTPETAGGTASYIDRSALSDELKAALLEAVPEADKQAVRHGTSGGEMTSVWRRVETVASGRQPSATGGIGTMRSARPTGTEDRFIPPGVAQLVDDRTEELPEKFQVRASLLKDRGCGRLGRQELYRRGE